MLEALLRRGWIIALGALVVGIGAFSVAKRRPPSYAALAQLQVNDANTIREALGIQGSLPLDAVLAETPAQVHRLATAERAVRLLRSDSRVNPQQLLAQTGAAVDPNTGLIGVSAQAANPNDATNFANALAQAYLDLEHRQLVGRIYSARVELGQLLARRTRLLRQRAKRTGRAGGLPDPAAASVAASELGSLADRIAQLQLITAITPQPVSFDHPAVGASFAGTSANALGLIGVLLGLIGGVVVVAVKELTDRRIRSVRQLEQLFNAPVLARVPDSRRLEKRIAFADLRTDEAEPFRVLLARLWRGRASETAGHAPSVVITSPDGDEDSFTTAWYLAATANASGARTLLIPANRSRIGHDAANGSSADAGFKELDLAAPDAVHVSTATAHPQSVAGHRTTAQAVYDYIVIETLPPSRSAQAVPVVRGANGVVVVCGRRAVYPEQAENLRATLQALGTPLLGIVATGFRERDA